ncbi:MAG: energy transducer TonB [Verrucomicrobiota bacterium]
MKPHALLTLITLSTGCVLFPVKLQPVAEQPVSPEGVMQIDQLTKAPETVKRFAPAYPSRMRKRNISGDVTVQFVIRKTGQPTDIRVVRANAASFGLAAKAAVERSVFKPGELNGVPVDCLAEMSFHFETDR